MAKQADTDDRARAAKKKAFYTKQRETAEAEFKKTGKKSDVYKSLEKKGYEKSGSSSKSGSKSGSKPAAKKSEVKVAKGTTTATKPKGSAGDDGQSPITALVKKIKGGPNTKPAGKPYNPAQAAKPSKGGTDTASVVARGIGDAVRRSLPSGKPSKELLADRALAAKNSAAEDARNKKREADLTSKWK